MSNDASRKKENNESINAPPPATRRRILKGLAAGAGVAVWHSSLPSRWTAPIIKSISLPVHAQTSAPIDASLIPVCKNLAMKQVEGDSFDSELTVSASGQFPTEYAGQVFNMTFDAYKEVVVTQTEEKNQGLVAAAAGMFGAPSAHAASPACTETVQVTAEADGSFTAQVTLTCGPGYKQVIAIIRTGASGGSECCRGVLDIAGCNPCGTSSADDCPNLLNVVVINNSTRDIAYSIAGNTGTVTPTNTVTAGYPISSAGIPVTYTVINSPNPVLFQIQVTYCDGSTDPPVPTFCQTFHTNNGWTVGQIAQWRTVTYTAVDCVTDPQ